MGTAYLARPIVDPCPPACWLICVGLAIPGFVIVATIRNGVAGQARPYMQIPVSPYQGGAGDDLPPPAAHPPQTTFLGRFPVLLGDQPAFLEITTE